MTRRRLVVAFVACFALLASMLAFGSVDAIASSTPATIGSAAAAAGTIPPLTDRSRSTAGREHIRRGARAHVALVGVGGAPNAASSGHLPSIHSSAAVTTSPLSSPPPPVLPDDLAGFAGSAQAQAIQSFGTDQELTPPDPDIAVGPTDIVEVVNSGVFVLSRNGAILASDDLNTFMDVPSGYHSSDPKVIFDGESSNGNQGRFWITVTEVPNSLAGCPHSEPVLIAVSPSSSPLPFTGWLVYSLPTGLDNPGTMLGDAPSLSVADSIVTVTFNDFSCSLTFLGSEIDVLQKSDLMSDTGADPLVFYYDGPFAPQPVQPSFEPGTADGPVSIVTNESDCGAVACTNPAVELELGERRPRSRECCADAVLLRHVTHRR